jgi:nucleotide-binding universal stress UspA family protein
MYHSILVPLDGSKAAEHALPLAASIARRAGATLQLVHIHDSVRPMFMDAVPLFDDRHDAEHRERERAYLDDLANRLSQHGKLTIRTMLLDGAAANTIALYALASCVDLVVMTTHGRGTQIPAWLGSVADELVQWAPIPLLLIRPDEESPDMAHKPACRRMLIVIDSSARSEQYPAHPIALGTLLRAEYTLLYVIEPAPAAYRTAPDHRINQPIVEQQRRQAQAYLDRIAARLRAEALCVRTHVAVGEPAVAISDYTHEHAVDLIAMETHARNGVAQLLLGSVADQVLRGTPVPLLLYHPHAVAESVETCYEQELSRYAYG